MTSPFGPHNKRDVAIYVYIYICMAVSILLVSQEFALERGAGTFIFVVILRTLFKKYPRPSIGRENQIAGLMHFFLLSAADF